MISDDLRKCFFLLPAQVESLLADGHLSVKERGTLLRLQGGLEMDAETSNRIELEVLDALAANK